MSSRAKFLISLLFIVVIILCVCLTKFYYDVSQNTGNHNDEDRIDSVLSRYSSGLQLFQSTDGYYGLLDEEGAIVIEPEWMEILAVTEDTILVSKQMDDVVRIGGIDYEENVVIPFAFRSMEPLSDAYYLGIVAEDGSCILYDSKTFEPVFSNSWDSVEYSGEYLYLERSGCLFTYRIHEDKQVFQEAAMVSSVGSLTMEWNVRSSVYLSELGIEGLTEIGEHLTAYMDMLLDSNFSGLMQISDSQYISGLSINDAFTDAVFETISDVSFSGSYSSENRIYDLAFTIAYHTSSPLETITGQSVQVHFYFQKNAENDVILTSVNLDFHSSEPAADPDSNVG